ncbi:cyclic peptide export ABC transporter [Chitinophaga oryzae]|uniref:Cyclic peptide export ABC transporter n=1 Tax=Chitinophaga oryzae TaxID=2725414 RepID=A0AAE6ZH24_9BACT|nr:cyclic peptide export ABC transporter [Chitinophaga oryzae]QJB31659.1 cyclic peptide export ABC transporter [Chitinophaga oryzae]QJB38141.1 cyclic peptide export ABC transporter [Chitinophaga oryzae]
MLQLKTRNALFLLMYAVPNTILSFGIVYIINNALAGKEGLLGADTGWLFLGLVICTYALNIFFQRQLNRYSFHLLYENEKHVFGKILRSSLPRLEKFGSKRFFTAVEDLRTFSFLPYAVTHTVNSLLMLVLCIIYMFSLSVIAALVIMLMIAVLAGVYLYVVRAMSKKVRTLRSYNEQYFQYVDDVMKGFKELKLSFFRRENLMNKFLVPNRNNARDLDFRINYIFLSIGLVSQYGLYFVVGLVLFVLPFTGWLSTADIIAYVVMILFISGPVNNLINLQQIFTRFRVANGRIKKFMSDFEMLEDVPEQAPEISAGFNDLVFKNIHFNYDNDAGETMFSLGPVDLQVNNNETIFIIGGNGSGKSTFINLLTGLYKPSAGQIVLNGEDGPYCREKLQSLIAAVFTDNHLFSQNYETFSLDGNPEYGRLLQLMQLDKVVGEDSEAAARRKFSKGQSKRMSLIFALLEQKPVIVLDEWAADQDPHFRKYFYEILLPQLKQQGKTVIAVTHDDAYFHLADRIVKFDKGIIVKDVRVKTDVLHSEAIWS